VEAGVPNVLLHIEDFLAALHLVPVTVELLGRLPELNQEIAREILGLGLATLFSPQTQQCG
jgi:hypothetical protein